MIASNMRGFRAHIIGHMRNDIHISHLECDLLCMPFTVTQPSALDTVDQLTVISANGASYLKIFNFYRLEQRFPYQNKQQKHEQFFRSRSCFCFLFYAANVSGGHFYEKMGTIISKTILCSHE